MLCYTLLFEMLSTCNAPVYCLLRFLMPIPLKTASKTSIRIHEFCLIYVYLIYVQYNPTTGRSQCFHPSLGLAIETLHFPLSFRTDLKQSLAHGDDSTVISFADRLD